MVKIVKKKNYFTFQQQNKQIIEGGKLEFSACLK